MKSPFDVSAIYHDDKFTYIKSSAAEKFSLYELKDGKPDLITFQLKDGTYVIPTVVDHGYLEIGKHKLDFQRKAQGDAMAEEKQTNTDRSTGDPGICIFGGAVTSAGCRKGVVPKQAQGYVIAGLAVLILLAVMFSKNHAKPAPKDVAPAVSVGQCPRT
jgi:hypothetical protein